MDKVEFHNREREIKEIKDIISSLPNLITFIYGPINSGKTELINHLVKNLPQDYKVFYINLRGVYISNADDFLKVLFEVNEKDEGAREFLKVVIDSLPDKLAGIPIPKPLFSKFFEEKEIENVFRYLEEFFTRISEKYTPILIIDELQVIGDVKIDELLIYRIFNFFIRLTKEFHVCHVFAITSDSIFIERIYSEAMLQGRCRYLLVGDFDYQTTVDFLKRHNFSEEEIKIVWNYFGGKPVYLIEAVRVKNRLREITDEFFRVRLSQMKDTIYELEERNKELFTDIIELFSEFRDKEEFKYEKLSKGMRFCVKKNILFAEPIKRVLRPQSRLELLAMREIEKSMKWRSSIQ